MARIFLVCLVLFAAALPLPARADRVDEAIFQDFDAAPLNRSEKRLLQTALAVSGDYRGPLDGDWGGASQAALAAYAAREFDAAALNAHAAALVLGFIDEVSASGWDFRYLPELGVSLALPLARLGDPEPEEGGERRWSDDGRLTVLTHRFDAGEARRWHGAAVKASADAAALVTERRRRPAGHRGSAPGRAELLHPLGSRPTGAGPRCCSWASPSEAGALNLAAASIRPGQPLPWDLPEGGRLSRLVSATEAYLASADPGGAGASPAAAPGSPRSAALPAADFGGASTGTGFYRRRPRRW